ncbi:GIY-YIG nuclease family protein [Synechococcus sp. PCC 7336]|uniref:GIY-YIG nuclease family protein n=1 Tax=Synechococcus sp. PCC 7336 TaxID=195250 RepID=UPI00034D88DF|nr:GIY-YIG nuclease family protein [Synechococcus sp. PCC 7336]
MKHIQEAIVPTPIDILPLESLEFVPYIDDSGYLPDRYRSKVGVYAIFDRDRTLHYIGYSRDIALSLKLHLIRQPHLCHWVKAQTIERPSRTALEQICAAWIEQNGRIPAGNASKPSAWDNPIDVKPMMAAEELASYADPAIDDRARTKVLKQVARRVEAEILAILAERNLQEPLRFHPKLKDKGLLDLQT